MKIFSMTILLALSTDIASAATCHCKYNLVQDADLIQVTGPGSYEVKNKTGVETCKQYGKDVVQNFQLYYSNGETLENLNGVQDLECA